MSNGWPTMAPAPAPVAEAQANAQLTPEQEAERIANRDKTIMMWRAAKSDLDENKTAEMDLRQRVTNICFPNPIKGTQRYELGQGYKLKLVHGWSYTLGNKDLVDPVNNTKVPVNSQVEGVLDAIEALGNEGPLLAERLIKMKYELSESEYLALDPELELHKKVKELIDSILTIKPASPQLTLEEPKAK